MKRLSELLNGLPCQVKGSTEVEIEDIVFDSRAVKPGALFFAFRGTKVDGQSFIEQAITAGARAIVVDTAMPPTAVPLVRVEDLTRALAWTANRLWDFPSRRLLMVGITGTNGKTTTSFLVEHLLTVAGWPTGVLGTIHYRFGDRSVPAPNTTPYPSELQRFLAKVANNGGKACVMEVSSHALALGRVEEVEFDVGVFTNLTQDHLDFHKTMDEYQTAKSKLFSGLSPDSQKPFTKRAILNAADPASAAMAAATRVPVWQFNVGTKADIYATAVESTAQGTRFVLHAPDGKSMPVHFPLIGHYNVQNALGAAGAVLSQGIALDVVAQGLASAPGVPGRLERVEAGQAFTVVVDYAHTDDALRQVMTALRKLQPRKLITVFGCGGDRDRTKRPLMGQAAAELSDEVFVTSDNPRSEDPARIILDIEIGVRRIRSEGYRTIFDREEAIHAALQSAGPGDIVLIAGKGHENYQILNDRTIPFSDRDVAHRLLSKEIQS